MGHPIYRPAFQLPIEPCHFSAKARESGTRMRVFPMPRHAASEWSTPMKNFLVLKVVSAAILLITLVVAPQSLVAQRGGHGGGGFHGSGGYHGGGGSGGGYHGGGRSQAGGYHGGGSYHGGGYRRLAWWLWRMARRIRWRAGGYWGYPGYAYGWGFGISFGWGSYWGSGYPYVYGYGPGWARAVLSVLLLVLLPVLLFVCANWLYRELRGTRQFKQRLCRSQLRGKPTSAPAPRSATVTTSATVKYAAYRPASPAGHPTAGGSTGSAERNSSPARHAPGCAAAANRLRSLWQPLASGT